MLSFKDNFEVNNEIKDVTETVEAPEHILLIQFVGLEETACVYFCFLSSRCRNHLDLCFLTAGCSQPPLPPARGPPRPLPVLVPTVSTAKCDALIFFLFCFCIVFVLFVWNFFLSY